MLSRPRGERGTAETKIKEIPHGITCPVCSNGDHESLGSDLHCCRKCKSVFNAGHTLPEYNEKYFLEEYREQYGKTYIEDFETIYSLSVKRIETILGLKGERGERYNHSLLDIGSAAGFFLKAASDRGIKEVEGIEISRFASDYCKNEFGIRVRNEPFEKIEFSRVYTIITAWYFIEHTPDPVSVIEQIYTILEEGGVFAFSLPSVFGPLYILNRKEWIETHPEDHSLDFHPAALKRLLRRTGFRKVLVNPAGFHPERVLNKKSPVYRLFCPLYRIFAKMTGFSDTVEVFAIK